MIPHIIEIQGKKPQIDPSCFIATNATITGDVTIAEGSSVWFNCVIRGDVCTIKIGKNVNIQDASIIHGTLNISEVLIGDNVSIGHRAIIHGCTIHDSVLIGMGAIILDNATIESNCIVAAGAVVLQNEVLESGYLYAGIPAKKMKRLDEDKMNFYINGTSSSYVELSRSYKDKQ